MPADTLVVKREWDDSMLLQSIREVLSTVAIIPPREEKVVIIPSVLYNRNKKKYNFIFFTKY